MYVLKGKSSPFSFYISILYFLASYIFPLLYVKLMDNIFLGELRYGLIEWAFNNIIIIQIFDSPFMLGFI